MTIKQIREFNRYYTRVLGVFDKKVFDLDFSMIEMRIIGEISRNSGITANQLVQQLNIKKSYLSQILNKLEVASLIRKEKDITDGRVYRLFLTSKGEKLNIHVEKQSDQQVTRLIENLTDEEITNMVNAMAIVKNTLDKSNYDELEEK